MKRWTIFAISAAALSWPSVLPEVNAAPVTISQPQLKDMTAVKAAWQELQKAEVRDAAWRLKTEAVWDRWASLDERGAVAALENQPAEGQVTGWDTEEGERAGYLPHRRVFFVLAGKGKAHALKQAEGRPWREHALKGAGERLAQQDPAAYFALKDSEREFRSPRCSGIAFRRWLEKDFRAAKAWVERTPPEKRPRFPNDEVPPDQLLCERWLVVNVVELAEAVLARKLPRDSNIQGLYPQLIAALEKKKPDLLTKLGDSDPQLLAGMIATDFAAALALAERMPGGAQRVLCSALTGDARPSDPAAAAAWITREIGGKRDVESGLSHAANSVLPDYWEQNPDAAAAWLATLPEKEAVSIVNGKFAQRLIANAPPAEQDHALDKLPPAAARALTSAFLRAYAGQLNRDRVKDLLPRLPPGRERDHALESLASAEPDDAKALAIIAEIQDERERHDLEATRIAASLRKRNEPPEQLLAGIQTPAVREALAIRFSSPHEQDPFAAWQWSLLITDQQKRQQAQDSIMGQWPLALRREAVRLINEAGSNVPDQQRERWLKRFQ